MDNQNHPPGISAENLLGHWLAALKYRLTIAITGAAGDFASFDAGSGVKTPIEILFHISQLLRHTCSTITSSPRLRVEIGTWDEEVARFYEIIEQLDQAIVQNLPEQSIVEMLVQGPLTDATSHVGQLSMLRRLAGNPVASVNFAQVNIRGGE